jgi:hypothetical protein
LLTLIACRGDRAAAPAGALPAGVEPQLGRSVGQNAVRPPSGAVHVKVLSGNGVTYFFQGASGNDKPDSKTRRSLDSTPSGNPLTTYASIAYALKLRH